MKRAPVLFISHGSPMMAAETSGPASLQWQAAAKHLVDTKAIVIMSPHWMRQGSIGITAAEAPGIMHDFGGFPESLYRVQYNPKGSEALSSDVTDFLRRAGFIAETVHARPLDHGAWVPLMHLNPEAEMPVIQLSVDMSVAPKILYQQGQALAELRDAGVALIGSGALTHNLADARFERGPTPSYVNGFRNWVRERVVGHQHSDLLNAAQLATDFHQAHPYDDHFRPLYFALGAASSRDKVSLFDGGVYHGCLAMENYVWHA